MTRPRTPPLISIVVPLYNEEDSVTHLYEAIVSAMRPVPDPYEIVFVDDGSKDNTLEIAKALITEDNNLRVIEFRKNCGQTPAMAAGIDHAYGEILVTMDGDLQNDPSDIPAMIEELKEGYDIVVGWRHNRQDKLITRKIPSVIANKLIAKITGVPIKDNGCSLKVYRAEVMKKLPFYNEMHRFIPALLSLSGARVSEVKVKHHARQFGESKYGLSRIYKVLLDLLMIKTILSMLSHPIHWFGLISLLPLIFCGLIFAEDIISTASYSSVILSSIITLSVVSSAFLFSLGLICELVYKKGDFKLHTLAPLTSSLSKNSPQKDNSTKS